MWRVPPGPETYGTGCWCAWPYHTPRVSIGEQRGTITHSDKYSHIGVAERSKALELGHICSPQIESGFNDREAPKIIPQALNIPKLRSRDVSPYMESKALDTSDSTGAIISSTDATTTTPYPQPGRGVMFTGSSHTIFRILIKTPTQTSSIRISRVLVKWRLMTLRQMTMR